MLLATLIDTKAIRDVILWSFAAGIGVTAIFGLVIYGSTRFADMRRDGNAAGAVLFGALAVVGLAVVAASVVLGIVVMTRKS
jgi:hypothetical protein